MFGEAMQSYFLVKNLIMAFAFSWGNHLPLLISLTVFTTLQVLKIAIPNRIAVDVMNVVVMIVCVFSDSVIPPSMIAWLGG